MKDDLPSGGVPTELERYTLAPAWAQGESDERRRQRALRELAQRMLAAEQPAGESGPEADPGDEGL